MIDYENLSKLKDELLDNQFWDLEIYNGNLGGGTMVYSYDEQEIMKLKCKELKMIIFLVENDITSSYDEKNYIRCAND